MARLLRDLTLLDACGYCGLLAAALVLAACIRSPATEAGAASDPQVAAAASPPQAKPVRKVRATGTVRAVRQSSALVPSLSGQPTRLVLTRLVPNGAQVKAGDVLAEFDRTAQIDAAREADAKFDEFAHQVEQRKAQNRSDAEKRHSELQQAEADLAKAELQVRRGPVLADIERLKNEIKAEIARVQVASLKRSQAARDRADDAALRILELKRDRQKVALERALHNLERLVVRAPLEGMAAHENIWRSGTMGPPQEGDQLWPGQPLVRIFDPTEMEVLTSVGEPDGAVLAPGARAEVRLDAYPDLVFRGLFHSASPVASAPVGSPIKTFTARFRLERSDPHLLPDLSAAVIIEPGEPAPANGAAP